jgi:hypothetical protein
MVKAEPKAITNYFYIDSDGGRARSQEFGFATVQVFVNGNSL